MALRLRTVIHSACAPVLSLLVATAAGAPITAPAAPAAPTAPVPAADRATARPLALPVATGESVHVGAAAFDGRQWWLAGSVRAAPARSLPGLSGAIGNREDTGRPALWRSPDLRRWSAVATRAITGYGEVSALYTLAVTPSGVAAVGAATGGVHGNPRTVTWLLSPVPRPDVPGSAATLQEVAAPFELYNGPRQIGVGSVIAGPGGWVIVGSRVNRNGRMGATTWTSATGADFVIHDDDPALSARLREQIQAYDVTTFPGGLLAVGERFWVPDTGADTDALVWTSDDGAVWRRWSPVGLDLGGPGAQRAQRVAADGDRLLVAGTETAADLGVVAWTRSGNGAWTKVRIDAFGTSADVLSAVTDAVIWRGRYYVAARMGGRLALATSADGRSWRRVPLPDAVPDGRQAALSLAASDTTLVLAARSETGGGAWAVEG